MQVAQSSLKNVPAEQIVSLADSYPDLVSRLHVQVRLMRNFYLNAGGSLAFRYRRALFVLYAEKVRIMLVTFSLNAARSEILSNLYGPT